MTKVRGHAGWGNLFDIGCDRGELVTVLREQVLQYHDGAGDLGGIVLAFDRDRDLRLFEPLENVGLRYRIQSLVVNVADGRLFADDDDELHAFGRVNALNPEIFEVPRIPKRVEVALNYRRVVHIVLAAEQSRQNRFLGDAAVSNNRRLTKSFHALRRHRSGGNPRRHLRGKGGSCNQEDSKDGRDMSNAGTAGARAHRFGLAFQGASALSIHGKDTHTLTALKMTLRHQLSEVSIIWERRADSEFAPGSGQIRPRLTRLHSALFSFGRLKEAKAPGRTR